MGDVLEEDPIKAIVAVLYGKEVFHDPTCFHGDFAIRIKHDGKMIMEEQLKGPHDMEHYVPYEHDPNNQKGNIYDSYATGMRIAMEKVKGVLDSLRDARQHVSPAQAEKIATVLIHAMALEDFVKSRNMTGEGENMRTAATDFLNAVAEKDGLLERVSAL